MTTRAGYTELARASALVDACGAALRQAREAERRAAEASRRATREVAAAEVAYGQAQRCLGHAPAEGPRSHLWR